MPAHWFIVLGNQPNKPSTNQIHRSHDPPTSDQQEVPKEFFQAKYSYDEAEVQCKKPSFVQIDFI